MKTSNILRRTLSLVLVLTLVFTQMPTVFAAENVSITNQPKNYVGTVSSDAVFTVSVSEDGCSYRWQQKSPSASNWTNASGTGATSPTLTVRVRAALDGYSYRCQIKDSTNNVYYSDATTLQVSGSFQIVEQPQNYEGLVGSTAVFTVTTDTENLTYAWQRQLPGSDVWSNTSDTGYRTNTLSVAVRNSVDGYKYRCKITDADGTVIYTEPALLTVKDSFVILNQPESKALIVGETEVFSVATDKDGLSYRWQQKTPTSTSWTNSSFSGYSTASMSVKALTRYNGYHFRCMIMDANDGVVYSEAATPTVSGTFAITKQPEDFTGLVGDTAVYTVETNSNTLTYYWQYMSPRDTTWRNASYTGSRTSSMSVKITNSLDNYQFRCKITDADGTVFYSDAAKLIVRDSFQILEQPQNSSASENETIILTVLTDTGGLTYRWQQMAPNTTTWRNSGFTGYYTSSMQIKMNKDYDGYKFRCRITDANGGVVYSTPATVTLRTQTALEITQQPQNFRGKVGDTAVFIINAAGDGLAYLWQYRNVTESAWTDATLAGFDASSLSVPVTEDQPQFKYRCLITDTYGNTVFSNEVAIELETVEFAITAQPEDYFGAVNGTAVFSMRATGEGLSYRWQYRTSDSASWTDASDAPGYDTFAVCVDMVPGLERYSYRCIVTNSAGETLETPAVHIKYLTIPAGYEKAYEYISLLMAIDEKLDELGIGWETIQNLSQRDASFYQDMADILEREGYDTSFDYSSDLSLSIPSASANCRAYTLIYSHYTATESIAQEGGVGSSRSVEREAIYMLLSHYVDVPGVDFAQGLSNLAVLDASVFETSEIGRWITDYDRQAYDNYLNALAATKTVVTLTDLMLTIGRIKAGLPSAAEIQAMEMTLVIVNVLAAVPDAHHGLVLIASYFTSASPDKNAEELYDLMKMNYIGNTSSFHSFLSDLSWFVGFGFLLTGNPMPLLLSIASDFTLSVVNSMGAIFNAVAWAGMTSSRNMRISYRYMRLYGMI